MSIRPSDIEDQDDLLWMSEVYFDLGEMPTKEHFPEIKEKVSVLYREVTKDSWKVAAIIDDQRYIGGARERLRAAESALREASRELFMALGEL